VARNVQKGEAPTLLRESVEIRLDKNLDGLFAGINLVMYGRVAEVDLLASSVLVEFMAWGIVVPLRRIRGDIMPP